ncbi:protein Turandot M-like [Drosophila kikkawai]|uniref:Protein Turandot M-like n=1 Tax=Drosophila kikkawai TaxID=30033 RepID=A0A6P4I3B9_DROKI|nr:protein Turandot M-like [Drosophila kikkawai]
MNTKIFLSCLVVIIGSLVWTVSAQEDFEIEKERVIELFKNADAATIGESNVVFLVNFLKKYSKQITLTPEQQAQVDDIVTKYNEEKDKQPVVEGAPPQGGWITDMLKKLAVQVGKTLVPILIKAALG